MPLLGSIAGNARHENQVLPWLLRHWRGHLLRNGLPDLATVLVVYILATIGLNGSLTFYDSMLIDATSNERMDKVSSHGYGWGYIGSTVPFIFCITR